MSRATDCVYSISTRSKSNPFNTYEKLMLNKRSIVILLFIPGLGSFVCSPLLFQSGKHFLHAPAHIYYIMSLFCLLNLKLNSVILSLVLIYCCTEFFFSYCLLPNIRHCYFTFDQVNVKLEHRYFINRYNREQILRKS